MLDAEDPVTVSYEAHLEKKADTPKAYLVQIGGEEVWLPKSQCELNEDSMLVEMPTWLAEKRGFDYD